MGMYRPSELREFLDSLGIYPKKSLSQNFLIDGNIMRKIVTAAETEPGDLVLEIGPGPGSLTQGLLQAGARVLAVEKDPMLAKALERLEGDLEIFCSDIMEFGIEDVLRAKLQPGRKAKVIANLPYHLTTPILILLAPLHHLISKVVVMVQAEVAERICAAPKTHEYSSLSVFLRFYSQPSIPFYVSKHCFYPVPKVDSAIVMLRLREPPSVASEERFFRMTRTAFEHRRKMLRGSLKDLYGDKVETALERVGCNPQARPEELALEDFLGLFKLLDRDGEVL